MVVITVHSNSDENQRAKPPIQDATSLLRVTPLSKTTRSNQPIVGLSITACSPGQLLAERSEKRSFQRLGTSSSAKYSLCSVEHASSIMGAILGQSAASWPGPRGFPQPPGVSHGARGRVRVLVVGLSDIAEDDCFAADERWEPPAPGRNWPVARFWDSQRHRVQRQGSVGRTGHPSGPEPIRVRPLGRSRSLWVAHPDEGQSSASVLQIADSLVIAATSAAA